MSERIGLEGYLGLGQWSPNVLKYLQDVASMESANAGASRSLGGSTEALQYAADTARQSGQQFSGLEKTLSVVDRTAAGLGKTLLGMSLGTTTLTGIIYGLGGQAARLEGVRSAFQGLGGDIEQLRAATSGMVSDAQLMENYNRAALLVSKTFAQQLPEAMGYLQQVAMATGESMDYMLRSIVIGVGRLSPLILDNLGIAIKLEDAYKTYAQQIGKTTEALTKQEQQTAAFNEVMRYFERNFGAAGKQIDTVQGRMMRMNTQLTELRRKVGEAVLPLMEELLPAMQQVAANAAEMFDNPRFKEGVKDAAEQLGRVLNILTRISENKAALTVIELAIGWKLLGGAIKAAFQWLGSVFTFFTTTATGMAALPILPVAGAVALFTGTMVDAAKAMRSNRTTLQELSAELLASSRSYDSYVAKMVAAARQMGTFVRDTTDADIALALLDSGLLKTREQFDALPRSVQPVIDIFAKAEVQARRYGETLEAIQYKAPKMEGLGGRELLAAAERARSGFGGLRMYGEGADYGLWQDQIDAQKRALAYMGANYVEFMRGMESYREEYNRAIMRLDADHQAQEQENLFQYQMGRLQAEAEYQQTRAQLIAEGNAAALEDLDGQYAAEMINAETQYKRQEQLLDRALIQRKLIEAQAWQEKLELQRKNFETELALAVMNDEAFLALSEETQVAILKQLGLSHYEQLRAEIKFAQDKAKIIEESANYTLGVAETTLMALLNANADQIAAARSAISGLRADFAAASQSILAGITAPAVYVPPERQGPAAAVKAQAESVTKTLAQVSSEIRQAVEDAQAAIFKLAGFQVPVSVERGLQRMGDYLIMAVKRLYEVYQTLNQKIGGERVVRLGSLEEGMGHINTIIGIIKPAIDSMKALSEYESAVDLPARLQVLMWDMEESVRALDSVYQLLNRGAGRVRLGSLEEGAGHIANIVGVITPAVEAMKALSSYETGNLYEVMDVFEMDMFFLLDRLGAIGERMATDGVANALIFAQGAQTVADAVNAGMGLIRDSAGNMIRIDPGVPVGFRSALARGGTYNDIDITFGDVHIASEGDWNAWRQRITETVASAMEGL